MSKVLTYVLIIPSFHSVKGHRLRRNSPLDQVVLSYLFIIVIDRNQNLNKNFTFKLFSCATAVATGMSIGSNTSGAGLNPAVGIGSSFARAILLGSVSEVKQLWMFVVAPLLAAYCAGNTFTQVKDMYYNFKDANEETEKMGLQEVVQT